jgi:hypothetical protein
VYVTEVSNFGSNKDPKYIPEEGMKTANIGGKCTVLIHFIKWVITDT